MPTEPHGDEGRLAIGALSRATGIPPETLRTWEMRYGFPPPRRKPSGHRLYPLSVIPRLLRMAEALAHGHRAGQVVGATDAQLDALLDATAATARLPQRAPVSAASDLPAMLEAVRRYDASRLALALQTDWIRLGVIDFLDRSVAPLLRAAGDAWHAGALDVGHEHFLTEQLEDLLRTLRLPFDDRATGPSVVLATLPGETHGLGLQMVALVVASVGWSVLSLGTDVPVEDIVAATGERRARAVGISISSARTGAPSARPLTRLRTLLPKRVSLVIGGDGAPRRRRFVTRVEDFRALETWARQGSIQPVTGSNRPSRNSQM